MSEKLPRLTATEIIKILEKCGFVLTRQSGSHKIYKDEYGNRAKSLFIPARFFIQMF
jgi:predicted RNA binding protein YcfA (HicA-like mRNA interferase family)